MALPEDQVYRLLHLEDDPVAFELSRNLLAEDGLRCEFTHVENEADYVEVLRTNPPDLVLADFNVAGFNGLRALSLKQNLRPGIPFIFVSGSIAQDVAISSLRNGATDFILKDDIARLPSAVRRALEETLEHRVRVAAEARLKESEARFRRLSENAPDVIFRIELRPRPYFSYLSPAFERLTGFAAAKFMQDEHVFEKLIHPDDRQTFDECISRDGVVEDLRTIRWLSAAGEALVTEQRFVPIFDGTGAVLAVEGIARDITAATRERQERRQLEAELVQAQKLETIGTLAGGIAHDFNNILTGILGYTELARLGLDPGHAVQNDLAEVQRAGQRAKDLVAQILTFSRKSEARATTLNLARAVDEAVRLLRASTPATIRIETALAPVNVRADAIEIHQIVLNLGTNATHAMSGGKGTLALRTEIVTFDEPRTFTAGQIEAGPAARLTISDTGTGMDAKTLERIWDPFFTTKGAGVGTGLGLALVKRIVLGLQGGIEVLSVPGRGTVFQLYLPLDSESPNDTRPPLSATKGNGERVVIVDDESTIGTFIAMRLGPMGYEVALFRNAHEALEAIQKAPRHFSAVLTDASMPQMTGEELVLALRAAGSKLPAIIVSGSGHTVPPAALAKLQPVLTLPKPFSGEELLATLHAALHP